MNISNSGARTIILALSVFALAAQEESICVSDRKVKDFLHTQGLPISDMWDKAVEEFADNQDLYSMPENLQTVCQEIEQSIDRIVGSATNDQITQLIVVPNFDACYQVKCLNHIEDTADNEFFDIKSVTSNGTFKSFRNTLARAIAQHFNKSSLEKRQKRSDRTILCEPLCAIVIQVRDANGSGDSLTENIIQCDASEIFTQYKKLLLDAESTSQISTMKALFLSYLMMSGNILPNFRLQPIIIPDEQQLCHKEVTLHFLRYWTSPKTMSSEECPKKVTILSFPFLPNMRPFISSLNEDNRFHNPADILRKFSTLNNLSMKDITIQVSPPLFTRVARINSTAGVDDITCGPRLIEGPYLNQAQGYVCCNDANECTDLPVESCEGNWRASMQPTPGFLDDVDHCSINAQDLVAMMDKFVKEEDLEKIGKDLPYKSFETKLRPVFGFK